MPRLSRHHVYHSAVCLLCFKKSKGMHSLTLDNAKFIKENNILKGIDPENPKLPTSLCPKCRILLNRSIKQSAPEKVATVDYKKLLALPYKCFTCTLGKSKNKQTPLTLKAKRRGRPLKERSMKKGSSSSKICTKCLTSLSPGKRHSCYKSERLNNLKLLCLEENQCAEKVAVSIMKNKAQNGNSSVSLSQQRGNQIFFFNCNI